MEKEAHKETINLINIFGIGLLLILANSAFSWKTKQAIKQRDGGQSVLSGKTENLHAAHIDHNKNNPRYDDASNGRLLTAEEHLKDHINRAGRNGLTVEQNNWAISMLMKLLSSG
jgi:hypothetical protein